MDIDELTFVPAHRLLTLLGAREISAAELTNAYLDKVRRINPRLNAVVTVAAERALLEAHLSDMRRAHGQTAGPLEGLPITIKDSIATAGIRSTSGTRRFEHYTPSEDAIVVARLRAAGAIVIGKTNIPELAADVDCDNPIFGPTSNPWDLGRVPGGSSGGEGAAQSAGLSAVGLGTDTGGSIRIPAHFCGVCGLKPGAATVPRKGAHIPPPLPLDFLSIPGPIARAVDDLTLVYNVIRGPSPAAPEVAPAPRAEPTRAALRKVRCGLFTHLGDPAMVQDEVRAGAERAARAIERLGVSVEPATPPIQDAVSIFHRVYNADGRQLICEALGGDVQLCRPPLRRYLETNRANGISAAEFFKAMLAREEMRAGIASFMERYPILLTVAFSTTAFPHGAQQLNINGVTYDRAAAAYPAMGWTTLWASIAGLPAAVVPAGFDNDGLPVGVQIVGRAFDEETVLAVAGAIERELGGYQRPLFKDGNFGSTSEDR
jgi:amidase